MKQFNLSQPIPAIFDEMRTVLAVHRSGSMAEAARVLGVTPSTVSRQVSRLREVLGFYPFVKSDGNWRLNPSLMNLIEAFENAEGMLANELRRLTQNEANPDAKREVKIAGPASIIAHVLIPQCPDLAENRPQVLPVFERRVNAEGLGLNDIVIAFHPPSAGRFKVRRCATFDYALYAPEGWEMGGGWITLIDKFAAAHIEEGQRIFGCAPSLKTDSFDQAARAMQILGLAGPLPRAVARNTPGLKELDVEDFAVTVDLFVIHHESRSDDPEIRATVDWIIRSLKKIGGGRIGTDDAIA
ncbi:LysR family transcriptional regulator [Aquicoccus sp.]|uniref:LysR family transcriptional regulator n=1 Tax=Aquicoccus sp. TaxID=2055851 RepID=UPI00356A48A7